MKSLTALCKQTLSVKLEENENELNSEKKNALKRDKTIQGLTQVLREKEKEVRVHLLLTLLLSLHLFSVLCKVSGPTCLSLYCRLLSCVMRLRTEMML